MRTLLYIVIVFLPLLSFAQSDTATQRGTYIDLSVNAGVALPIMKYHYSVNNKTQPGGSFRISPEFVFNKKRRRFYGFASTDAGVFNYYGNSIYQREYRSNGRDTLFFSDADEEVLYSMFGINGGVGYNIPLNKRQAVYLTLATGPAVAIDLKGTVKNQYGLHCAFAAGVVLNKRTSLGLDIFYSSAWLHTSSMPYGYARDVYNLLSLSVQFKLRLGDMRF